MQKSSFFVRTSRNTEDSYYDIYEDWDLIEASFAQQYNIRLRHTKMQWSEFYSLLGGINEFTPLGKIISIRSESDQETIKRFSPKQRQIRSEWLAREAKKKIKENPNEVRTSIEQLQSIFKEAFGGEK